MRSRFVAGVNCLVITYIHLILFLATQAFQTDEINGTSDTNHVRFLFCFAYGGVLQRLLQVLQKGLETEDDDTQNCFLNTDVSDETIDTGGITIPAGFELQVSL